MYYMHKIKRGCLPADGDVAVHKTQRAEEGAESRSRFHHQVAITTAAKWPVRTSDVNIDLMPASSASIDASLASVAVCVSWLRALSRPTSPEASLNCKRWSDVITRRIDVRYNGFSSCGNSNLSTPSQVRSTEPYSILTTALPHGPRSTGPRAQRVGNRGTLMNPHQNTSPISHRDPA